MKILFVSYLRRANGRIVVKTAKVHVFTYSCAYDAAALRSGQLLRGEPQSRHAWAKLGCCVDSNTNGRLCCPMCVIYVSYAKIECRFGHTVNGRTFEMFACLVWEHEAVAPLVSMNIQLETSLLCSRHGPSRPGPSAHRSVGLSGSCRQWPLRVVEAGGDSLSSTSSCTSTCLCSPRPACKGGSV